MPKKKITTAGIDFGSKLAGTTVICYTTGTTVQFAASQKKQDADAFILDFFSAHPVELIGIDAPLSLPAVYSNKNQSDYFYREADKALGAMSPMFLGGLTARAMRLSHQLNHSSSQVIEVYPGALARHLNLSNWGYKKEREHIPATADVIHAHLTNFDIRTEDLHSWHHVDALLCFLTTQRFLNNRAVLAGNVHEGIIVY